MISFQLIKNAFKWSFLRTLVEQFLTPFLRLIVVPIVGPVNYGITAIAFLYFRFIELLFPFGIRDFILSKNIDGKHDLRMLHTLAFIFSIIAFIICILISFLVSRIYDSSDISYAILFISILFPVIGIGLVPKTIIESRLKIKYLFYTNLLPFFSTSFIAIPLAIHEYGFWAILIAHFFNYSMSNILYFLINPLYFELPSKKLLKKLYIFGKWNSIEKSSEYLTGWIDLFFISFLGAEISGIYGFGKNLATLFFTTISSPIVNIILPIFSSMKKDIRKMTTFFVDVISLSILINICLGFMSSLFFYTLFQIFLTDWEDLYIVCLFLFISSVFSRSFTLLREYLKVQNNIKLYPLIIILNILIYSVAYVLINPSSLLNFLILKFFGDCIFAILMIILLLKSIRKEKLSYKHFISYSYSSAKVLFINCIIIYLIYFEPIYFEMKLFYKIGLILLLISVNMTVLIKNFNSKLYVKLSSYLD